MSFAQEIADVPPVAPKKRGGGPKTPEGKARAKYNAMTHGLRAKVLLPAELVAACEGHRAELTRRFAPANSYEEWLVGEMAMAMARLDRCAELAVADLQRQLDIAAFDWDDDRKTRVEDLGRRLPKDPSRVSHALEQSTHGADWLIARWDGIRTVLATGGKADDDLRRLAFDLKGVPLELRSGAFQVPDASDVAGLGVLAEREIARLRERQALCLEDRDESSRSMAMAGMPHDEDPGSARLRRYESGIRRSLEKARAELLRLREEAARGESQPAKARESRPVVPPMSGAAVEYQANRDIASYSMKRTVPASPVAVKESPVAPAAPVAAPDPVPASVVDRPVATGPAVAKTSGAPSSTARTAAHRTAAAPRNRFEQRVEKARARKAARAAAKGR